MSSSCLGAGVGVQTVAESFEEVSVASTSMEAAKAANPESIRHYPGSQRGRPQRERDKENLQTPCQTIQVLGVQQRYAT
jgi:hypothetical protein